MIRWALAGHWIEGQKECISRVNATLCRGVSILAKDDEFSLISTTTASVTQQNPNLAHLTPNSKNSTLSAASSVTGSSGNLLGSISPSVTSPKETAIMFDSKTSLANHFATFAGNVSNAIGSDGRRKRKESNKKRAGTLSSPLATLVAAVTVNSASLDREKSSAAKNNSPDVGVSTFAKITAEAAVKAAAEIALAQMLNHLGNFPPKNASCGVSRISTLFNEINEVKRILAMRNRVKENSIFTSSNNSLYDENSSPTISEKLTCEISLFRKYLRYFVYDNRVLLGFVEQPEWAVENLANSSESWELEYNQKEPKDPKIIIVIRDATGKFSWISELLYKEKGKKSIESQATPTVNASNNYQLLSPESEMPLRSKRPVSAPLSGRKKVDKKEISPERLPHESVGNIVETLSNPHISQAAESTIEYHVQPKLPPYIPINSEVLHAICFNESAIPKFPELVIPDADEAKKFEALKKELD
ncbi:hypothetical protein HK100_008013, partial [Physocladia obscura]